MRHTLLVAALATLLTAGLTSPVLAQYMYLDSNGDGIHTSADVLQPNGTPTQARVFLSTSQNRDGSPVQCPVTGEPLQFRAYNFVLRSTDPVLYQSYTSNLPDFWGSIPGYQGPSTDYTVSYYNDVAHLDPGHYLLGTVVVVGLSGSPSIDFVDYNTTTMEYTGFITQFEYSGTCASSTGDGWYRLDGPFVQANLGVSGDWFDVDGLDPSPGTTNQPPVVNFIPDQTAYEGTLFSLTLTASDPDGDPLTFSYAGGGPPEVSITATGYLTWTPSEMDGGYVYPIDYIVSDGIHLAGGSFIIVTNEVNQSPTVDSIDDQTVSEGATLTLNVTATDVDWPVNTITRSLVLAPLGASITPDGTFSWTPGEEHGPGIYPVIVHAEDGTPGSFDDEDFTIHVTEANQAPVLSLIPDVTVNEGETVSFTMSATDADLPAQPLRFEVAGAPPGATMNMETGEFSWVATTPGTYPISALVWDFSTGYDFQDFTIYVLDVNDAPSLSAIGDRTVDEMTLLAFTATASDADLPGQTLTFSLAPGAPDGASISSSGEFTWTPDETQGSGIHAITVEVSDGALTDSETIQVTVAEVNTPPYFTAPALNRTIAEGFEIVIPFFASDDDFPANTLTYSISSAPAGATVDQSGLFRFTTSEVDGGTTYPITVNVTDNGTPALQAVRTITLTVLETNQLPVLAPFDPVSGQEGELITVVASATDADLPAQTLSFGLADGMGTIPLGASITVDGTFTWTPAEDQGGAQYVIPVVVDDGVDYAVQNLDITVAEVNEAPTIASIPAQTVDEGGVVAFTATATDPDSPPNTLTFTGASHGSITPDGQFTWTVPEEVPDATATVQVTVTDDGSPALQDVESVEVTINEVNQAPVWVQPSSMTVLEGATATQQLVATDADIPAQALTYSKLSGPFFLTVNTAGLVTVSPSSSDAGTYSVSVRVNDGVVARNASFQVIVENQNNAPVADANGPYNGSTGAPVTFDGNGSSDPDGDVLTYSWDFGDLATGAGAAPSHQYTSPGAYTVTLQVSDGLASDQDVTTATIITDEFDALVFFPGDNKLKLNAGKPSYCLQLQPVGGSFALTNVDLGSVVMISEGTGSVSQISSLSGKSTILDGDMNNDGIQEIKACFGKNDLRSLFSNLSSGTHTVTVAVEGSLYTGGTFHGEVVVVVSGVSGGALAASISPNPLNPKATLTLSLAKAGAVKVQLFDVQGRLMRTLMDGSAAAGYLDVEIDGIDAAGRKLASGMYYLNIETVEGRMTKPITILK